MWKSSTCLIRPLLLAKKICSTAACSPRGKSYNELSLLILQLEVNPTEIAGCLSFSGSLSSDNSFILTATQPQQSRVFKKYSVNSNESEPSVWRVYFGVKQIRVIAVRLQIELVQLLLCRLFSLELRNFEKRKVKQSCNKSLIV